MRKSIIASNVLATESIQFQSTAFFKELTLIFKEIKDLKKEEIRDSELIQTAAKVIKHHTGLSFIINVGDVDPCVEIPMVDKNNILINSFIKNQLNSADGLKLVNESSGVVRGKVNLSTGEVSGIFSEVEVKMHLPSRMFETSKFEPEEIAAITMHEVGHILVYFEYMARTVTTNQMLSGLSKVLDGNDISERETVLLSVKKAGKLSELDVSALSKSNNKTVTEIVVITNITKQAESELGSNVYDFSTWEYLADQYAARNGAGRYLVTGLEKIYKGMWNISFRSTTGYLAMEAFKLLMLFVLPQISLLLMAMDGSGDGSYDRPGARTKRVRDQIVENLKNKSLSKDDHERLTADLEAIDIVLKTINDRRQFVGVVWDTIIPSARKNINQERLQKELESIAVNELFVKSAELKQQL